METFSWLVLLLLVRSAFFAPCNENDDGQSYGEGEDDDTDVIYPRSGEYYQIDDMIFPNESSYSRAALSDERTKWPNGVMIYRFHTSVNAATRQKIRQAMQNWTTAVPCISFRPFMPQDTYNVLFTNEDGSGCSAVVGRAVPPRLNQKIQIGPGCSVGNIVHEMMHSFGFFHEHTRKDRDRYVRINWDNIVDDPNTRNNFNKDERETSYHGVPYNFESIMHYGKTFFSKDGESETITVINTNGAIGNSNNIGQRSRITPGDRDAMRNRYGCGSSNSGDEETNPGQGISTSNPPRTTTTTTRQPETTATAVTTKNPICNFPVKPKPPSCKQ